MRLRLAVALLLLGALGALAFALTRAPPVARACAPGGVSADAGAVPALGSASVRAAPPARRLVSGVFLDAEGRPLVDAGVLAFANAAAWLTEHSPHGCDAGPFTCVTQAAADEVLARARAGTLPFPEALASTRTDGDGGFRLEAELGGGFLVGTAGSAQALEVIPDEGEVTLTLFDPKTLASFAIVGVLVDGAWRDDVPVTVINPFTREVQTGRTDGDGQLAVTVPGPLFWSGAELPGYATGFKVPAGRNALQLTPPRSLRVRLVAATGPLDGTVEAFCNGVDFSLPTDGGVATLVDLPTTRCAVGGRAEGLSSGLDEVRLKGGLQEVTVTLSPLATVSMTLYDAETGGPVGDGFVLLHRYDGAGTPRALKVAAGARGLLRGHAPGPLRLEAVVDDYLPELREVTVVPGTTDVEFPLRRARLISGIVEGPDGGPVSGASITARRAGAGPRPVSSDADGGFRLRLDVPGPWEVTASHSSLGQASDRATAPATLRLSLVTVNALEVHVAGLQGDDWATVRMRALEPTPTLAWPSDFVTHAGDPVRRANVAPGRYRVTVTKDGFVPTHREVVVEPAGVTAVTVEPDPGHVVSGVVVNEQGQPVAGARVRASSAAKSDTAAPLGAEQEKTDGRGRFRLEHLPGGPLTLEAFADEREATLEASAPASELRLELAPSPRWTGRVVEPSGQPITRFSVNGKPVEHRDGRFDVTGPYLNLTAGERGAELRGTPRDVGDVVLWGAKPAVVQVRLPGGGPAVGAKVKFPGIGHYYQSTKSDGRVSYEFEDRGEERRQAMYALHAEGFAFFEATTEKETVVTLTPWLRVEGLVLNEAGEGAEDAVLVKGVGLDHELRVPAGRDGRFVARVAPGTWAFSTATTGSAAVLRIERDGQQVTLAPKTGGCELHVSVDPLEFAGAELTLVQDQGRETLRLPLGPAKLPLRCGRWRAAATLRDGSVRATDLELRPPSARLTATPADCRFSEEPCATLGPAAPPPGKP